MQATELLKYIENPHLLEAQNVKELQKIVDDFPYFQPAHFLLSLAAKKWDASVYQQSLKKTAIVATNRSRLFYLIQQIENAEHSKEPKENEKPLDSPKIPEPVESTKIESNQELDLLKAADVVVENLQAPEAKENAEVELVAQTTYQQEKDPIKAKVEPEEILEKEIQNQVVNAFVEKEILKTNTLHHPPKAEKKPESFVEWLSLLKKNNGQTHGQIEEQVAAEKLKHKKPTNTEEKPTPKPGELFQSKKEKNRALIDKIIESSPGIIRSKEEQKFYSAASHAKESLLENEHLVTETLAKIYALQGSVNKAVRAYEILSLKFPQKSAYFAALIQKLKSNQ